MESLMRKPGSIGNGVAALVCAVAVLLSGCTGKEAKAVPAPVVLEFTPAEVAQPMPMSLDASIDFSGALVAPGTAVVRAKAPGTLLALDVAEGSRVKAGQVIGRIDAAELTSRLA
ncbi:MAG TPA: biotin/lipoyl-binding protein, partial [Burkholderiaceae bacterium]|nr:biotin/lipoyl-binding protein [Burkholderiaceae bacterium]